MNIFVKTEVASALTGMISASNVVFALTDAVSISIITSTAAVIMAGMSAWFAYKSKVTAEATKTTAEATHLAVNSRLDLFMKTAEAAFKAEGVEKERKEEAQRKASVAEGVLAEKERANPLPLPPTL